MFSVTTVPMEDFSLRWRFTDPKYFMLPPVELEQIEPLDALSARRLFELRSRWRPMPSLHIAWPHVASTAIKGYGADEVARVREWLFQRNVTPKQQVYASWSSHEAAMTRWEIVATYWNAFWYPSSDDLVVFDASLTWALFLSHEEQAFFGSNSA